MPAGTFDLLLVEDSVEDAGLIQASLKVGLGQIVVSRVDRLSAAIAALAKQQYSVVLLDLNLPDSSGVSTFRELSACSNGTPIVVLSGMDDAETAIEAVGAGADDYVQKSHYDAQTLARSVRFAVERNARRASEAELTFMRSEMAAYFAEAEARGELRIADYILAADQFGELCKADLWTRMVFGVAKCPTEAEIDRVVDGAVDTFLARYGTE